jgi:hypothetical protein
MACSACPVDTATSAVTLRVQCLVWGQSEHPRAIQQYKFCIRPSIICSVTYSCIPLPGGQMISVQNQIALSAGGPAGGPQPEGLHGLQAGIRLQEQHAAQVRLPAHLHRQQGGFFWLRISVRLEISHQGRPCADASVAVPSLMTHSCKQCVITATARALVSGTKRAKVQTGCQLPAM